MHPLAVIVIWVLGLCGLYYLGTHLARRRVSQFYRRGKHLHEGWAIVKGQIAGEPIKSNWSKRDCVAYGFRLCELSKDEDSGWKRKEVFRDAKYVPFQIVTDEASVAVNANVVWDSDPEAYAVDDVEAIPKIYRTILLRRHDIELYSRVKPGGLFFNIKRKVACIYDELIPGQCVTASGYLEVENGSVGFRDVIKILDKPLNAIDLQYRVAGIRGICVMILVVLWTIACGLFAIWMVTR